MSFKNNEDLGFVLDDSTTRLLLTQLSTHLLVAVVVEALVLVLVENLRGLHSL